MANPDRRNGEMVGQNKYGGTDGSNRENDESNDDRYSKREMEDRNEDYDGYEPYRDSHYRKRYEDKRLSIKERQDHLKAKNIFVYTNGTAREGVKIVYSRKYCATLEKLFDQIVAGKSRYGKIRVDRLYKWPRGELVTCLADIEEPEQTVFVCSEKKKSLNTKVDYHHMKYEGSDSGSGGARSSRETFRSQKPSPTSVRSNRSSVRAPAVRPFTITVISNTNPQSQQSVFVNPSRQFEELLKDITEMLDMDYPPCLALYPVKYPREKVDSNSSFKKVMASRGVDQFYAVGGEGSVTCSSPRDASPSYGYSKQSNRGPKNGMRQQNGHYDGQQNNGGMSNGYDQNGYDDYQDSSGRVYRRQEDRSRPDGDDEDDIYTPRNNKPDRRRRESPGKPPQVQGNQRRVDDRYERRRDDYDDRRQKYDTDNDDRYNRGRNGRGRDDSEERDTGRKDVQRDTKGRYDKTANDNKNRNGQRLDTNRNDRSRNVRGKDASRDRRNGREESEERRYGNQQRESNRDIRGRANNARDDSRDRNGKDESPERGYGRTRKDLKRDDRGGRPREDARGRRDDSEDRGRGKRGRDETPNRGHDSRRASRDDSPPPTRSPSPTESEMGNRKQDVDNVNKLNRDDSIDM